MSNSLGPHGLQSTRLLCPWDSPGKNTGVGCHSLLLGIFLTQGSNLGLLHCRQILYSLSHWGSPYFSVKSYISNPGSTPSSYEQSCFYTWILMTQDSITSGRTTVPPSILEALGIPHWFTNKLSSQVQLTPTGFCWAPLFQLGLFLQENAARLNVPELWSA